MKQFLSLMVVISLFFCILFIFWKQEWKYLVPTPIPENYQSVLPKASLNLDSIVKLNKTKPIFLHFFSSDCPCSKYNIVHFRYLVEKYQNKINFYAVLFSDGSPNLNDNKKVFIDTYQVDIPIIVKNGSKIAELCGVYSTPQAVIIQKDNLLFYRGNYNKSRYCNDKNTNFAELAIIDLLQGKEPPNFGELATRAYGCELPEDYFQNNSK
jgi:hypothetical protein